MIVKLPTISKSFEDGKVIKKRGELEVQVDTSFLAHLKWEEHFQKILGYDLTTYTRMISKQLEDQNDSKIQFLGLLKLLYCYISSDKLPTFREFCALFDFEIADEILKVVGTIIEEVGNSASKN